MPTSNYLILADPRLIESLRSHLNQANLAIEDSRENISRLVASVASREVELAKYAIGG